MTSCDLKNWPKPRKVNQFKVLSIVTISEKDCWKYRINKVWHERGQMPPHSWVTGNHSKSRCLPLAPRAGEGYNYMRQF